MIEAVLVHGQTDEFRFVFRCGVCRKEFATLDRAYFAFKRPDAAAPRSGGVFAHKRCLDGRLQEVLGVSRAPLMPASQLFLEVFRRCPPPPKRETRPTHQHSLLHACRADGPIKVSWR